MWSAHMVLIQNINALVGKREKESPLGRLDLEGRIIL